jgi:hypothetical protein
MKTLSIAILTAFITLTASSVYAGRPLSTEDAGVLEEGDIEIECGFEYTKADNTDDNYQFLVVSSYGVHEKVQIGWEMPFDILRPDQGADEEGLSDITLFGKLLIIKENRGTPEVTLKPTLKFANGDEDKGLGSGDEDYGVLMAVSKTLEPFTLHGNIGYTVTGDDWDDTLEDIVTYGVACEYPITDSLVAVGEFFGEVDEDFDSESNTSNPSVGLTYVINDRLIYDLGYKATINQHDKTDHSLVTGITASF